jgi:hypothetical protein
MAEENIVLEEVSNPEGSPSEEQKPTTTVETPEDWGKLDGKSQDRFQKIVAMRNEALERADKAERELAAARQIPTPPVKPTVDSEGLTNEERVALEKIKKVGGFVTQADLEAEKEKIRAENRQEQDRNLLNTAHDKLEGKYTDKREYPSYDRQEIEEHMKKSGIYNPEAAYRDLYFEEIVAAEKKSGTSTNTKQPFTERTKPKTTTASEWDPDSLRERLRKPDGVAFYKKNSTKIDQLYNNWRQEGLVK